MQLKLTIPRDAAKSNFFFCSTLDFVAISFTNLKQSSARLRSPGKTHKQNHKYFAGNLYAICKITLFNLVESTHDS
jgi:hypothetical protein